MFVVKKIETYILKAMHGLKKMAYILISQAINSFVDHQYFVMFQMSFFHVILST